MCQTYSAVFGFADVTATNRLLPHVRGTHKLSGPPAGLQKAWVMPPRMAARQDVREQHQLDGLATQLDRHKIDSKASLAAAWQANPLLLKLEVSQWLQKRQRKVLDALWPKLLAQAAKQ